MRIPNVDGRYQTRDGSIKIEVTRETITFDIAEQQKVHIIDGEPVNRETQQQPAGGNSRTGTRIKQIIKDTNDILWG